MEGIDPTPHLDHTPLPNSTPLSLHHTPNIIQSSTSTDASPSLTPVCNGNPEPHEDLSQHTSNVQSSDTAIENTPPEDMPSRPTLIDALYTCSSQADKGIVKKTKKDPFIQNGMDLRKLKRTAKVLNNY